jgi:CRP/FNR family cyclic AMP-dependent transcriptional regulator
MPRCEIHFGRAVRRQCADAILLLLAHFGKEGKPETVIPKISQETLAEMVGTTRSRVSFFMNRFRKLGFVEYSGGAELQVHSSLLNVVLHD